MGITYIVVMGAGKVGFNLASFLISDGHDVTLIEFNGELCNKAASELDSMVICGNGTDMRILDDANLKDADAFVAATGNHEINLLACIMVKKFKIPKILARVSDPRYVNVFKNVGIDFVISPEITAASHLEKLIIRPKIADLEVLGKGDAELLDLTIDYEGTIGKKIGDLSPNDDFIIVAIHKNGNIVIPKPDMVLKKGIKVTVLVKTKFAQDVLERFTKL